MRISDKAVRGNCMKQAFYEIHSRSVLPGHSLSFCDKAIFQYPAHNSKSLIATLSHRKTFHIITTKGTFGNKCN